jgi:methylglutaconyl-CoA hydratase
MGFVETSFDSGVFTLTLADEARRNALSTELVGELVDALDAAEADPDVRVIVLTNNGNTFCAGANLAQQSSTTTTAPVAVRSPQDLFGRVRRSAKPYVGRIAGHCVAGGVGLAAAMDISIAADDAKFGFSEVRIGVAPAVISVVCLPKLRSADARSAFLRGNRFPAAEAARIGLINAAVPRDQLDAEVDAVIGDLLAGHPEAIAASKQLLDRVPDMDVDTAFAWTSELSARLFTSDAAREGMASFLEKRPAAWVRPAPARPSSGSA